MHPPPAPSPTPTPLSPAPTPAPPTNPSSGVPCWIGMYCPAPCGNFASALTSLGVIISISNLVAGYQESLASFKCKYAISAGGTYKIRIRLPGHAEFYCSRDNGNTVQTVTRVNDIRLARNASKSIRPSG